MVASSNDWSPGQPAITALRDGDKQSNPKQASGDKKLPLHLVPFSAIAEETPAYLVGMLKYGRNNWRVSGVLASTYVSAILRHLWAFMEGEDYDIETRASHLGSIRACCGIMIDAKEHGKLIDDRNYLPSGRVVSDMQIARLTDQIARLTESAASARAKFEDRNPEHFSRLTQEGKNEAYREG